MNRYERLVENETYAHSIDELLDRINAPTDEVRLSPVDKLTISYGLRFLRLELAKNPGPEPK